ncbi:MAG TPA: hypothetical protein VIX87_04445 [Steroidobacteraceae bacterium]
MTHTQHLITAAMAAFSVSGGAVLAATTAEPAPAAQATTWQHHHVSFEYHGFTTLYSCDGLEDKVHSILLFMGARPGVKVRADGCPRGPQSPSHMAYVTADFDTLAAMSDVAAGSAVEAQWTAFKLDAQRPFFMGAGDCELMESMRSVLTKSFTLRNLAYETHCTPHELSFADYSVTGQVLKTAAAHSG